MRYGSWCKQLISTTARPFSLAWAWALSTTSHLQDLRFGQSVLAENQTKTNLIPTRLQHFVLGPQIIIIIITSQLKCNKDSSLKSNPPHKWHSRAPARPCSFHAIRSPSLLLSASPLPSDTVGASAANRTWMDTTVKRKILNNSSITASPFSHPF